jgi:hypothetical protein
MELLQLTIKSYLLDFSKTDLPADNKAANYFPSHSLFSSFSSFNLSNINKMRDSYKTILYEFSQKNYRFGQFWTYISAGPLLACIVIFCKLDKRALPPGILARSSLCLGEESVGRSF